VLNEHKNVEIIIKDSKSCRLRIIDPPALAAARYASEILLMQLRERQNATTSVAGTVSAMDFAVDCGRITGKPEVTPADPIRATASGLPTIRELVGWVRTTAFMTGNHLGQNLTVRSDAG
jgi:hypothetical protein